MNAADLDPIDGQVLTMLRRPNRGVTPSEIAAELCLTVKHVLACVRRLSAAGYRVRVKRAGAVEIILTEMDGWPRIVQDGFAVAALLESATGQ